MILARHAVPVLIDSKYKIELEKSFKELEEWLDKRNLSLKIKFITGNYDIDDKLAIGICVEERNA